MGEGMGGGGHEMIPLTPTLSHQGEGKSEGVVWKLGNWNLCGI